ncbi:hypothetical protein ASE46_23965 [Bacillus sp. Root239]|nr:hypothetical protein ASE46_23965 [Bacillus sp. Root239]
MNELAFQLLTGKLVKQDVEEGEKWLRKSADTGDQWAMMELGYRLLVGEDHDGIGLSLACGGRFR